MSYAKVIGLGGEALKEADADVLRALIPLLPEELVRIMKQWPLIGVRISLDDMADRSRLGVEMQWMSADEIRSEATETYPGIVAVPRGYTPIGMCLDGSGDPYFYRNADGAIVRIPHDASSEDSLDESRIEVVADSVEGFLGVGSLAAVRGG